MKAPNKIELNTCTFSDIGLFDIDEEEVEYIRKDWVLKLLDFDNKLVYSPDMFGTGFINGLGSLRDELKRKISEL